MNKVIIMGNLGNDPEIKVLDSGKKVANFSIATNKQYKDANGEKQQSTEWHNCVAFGKVVDVIEQHFEKGKKYLIEGEIKTESWESQDGLKRYATKIYMNNFEFV